MKVLLTGALGNVGSYTVDALLEEGHEVVALDLDGRRARRTAATLDELVQVRWGDITDRGSLSAALEGVDAVVHLAAIMPPHVDRAPESARRVNVDATLALIELMEASATAKRLVFASSQGVFGEIQDREPPLRVDTPVTPTDEYGRHKVECEQAIRRSDLRWSILRLGIAVPTRLIGAPHDLRSAFEISARGRVEFVHPADAATAFARAVTCEEAIGRILYIGGGKACQMIHQEFLNELMSGIIGFVPTEAFVRTDKSRCYGDWMDTGESQKLLQYQRRGLSELKADMVEELSVLAPLIRLLRPVINWYVLGASPYLQQNRRADRSRVNASATRPT